MHQQLIKSLPILFIILCSGIIRAQETDFYPFECGSKWKLNLNVSPVLTRLKSDTYSSEEKSRLGFIGGADLAFYFKNTGKLRLGLSVGIDYNVYATKRSVNYSDSVWTTDAGGEQVHIYEQANVSEKQTASYLSVPLKLHLDYSITDQIDVYVNTGYFIALASRGNYTSDVILSRQGYYPRYNALIYDVDVEGSEYFYPTNKPVSDNGSLELKNSSGITAALGIKYKLTSKFSLFAGVKTCIALNNTSDYSGNNAIVLAGDYQTVNTLMSRGDKIKANAYGLEFGLTVNIGNCKKQKPAKTDNSVKEEIPAEEIKEKAPVTTDTSQQKAVVEILPVPAEVNKPEVHETAEIKHDSIKSAPVIEGKDDITAVPEPIELAFTSENDSIVNPPVNYNPRRVYTLKEVNYLLKQGVSVKKKYTVLQRIEFEFNTDKLTAESEKYLDQLVEFMRLQPHCMAKIIGHTDNEGTKEYNRILSEKRAASVMKYLVSKGVEKNRLSSLGYGSDKPIDTNDTPEGREKNRRVEFEITWD